MTAHEQVKQMVEALERLNELLHEELPAALMMMAQSQMTRDGVNTYKNNIIEAKQQARAALASAPALLRQLEGE